MSNGWKISVEQSGKNWRCRWRGKYGTGQETFVQRRDAIELRDSKKRDFQRHDAGLPVSEPTPSPKSIGQVADEYLDYSKREKDIRTYQHFDLPAITSLRRFLVDGRLVLDVKPKDVQDWKHSLPRTGTALMIYRQGCAFFNYAVLMRYIQNSPAKGIKKPPEGNSGRDLTDSEIVSLLEKAPEPLYRTGTFALNTLLRIGEICGKNGFRWEWVIDLPDGSWAGRYPANLRKGRSKVKTDLIFMINPSARAVMGARMRSGRVFPWSTNTIQQQIVAQRKARGLAEDISFHCFRHTGATRYLRSNGHMEDLLKSGLWKDPRSLMRYIHVDLPTLSARFRGLGEALPPLHGPQMRRPQGRRPQGL